MRRREGRPAGLHHVVAIYVALQLIILAAGGALGWDESIYVSQVSGHAPATWFGAPRARGVTLVAAPVAELTRSVLVLRLWLVAVTALGLWLAYRSWQRVVAGNVAALAAAGFAALWVTEYYGDQVMPNLYVALGAVPAAAFVVRAVRDGSARASLAAAACMAWVALLRPTDAAWLAAGLVLAVLVVTGWRRWRLAARVTTAVVAGAAVGALEWGVEAAVRFGGIGARLHEAGAQNAAGVTFSLPMFARAVNGPLLCRPCSGASLQSLGATWWLLVAALVAVAVGSAPIRRPRPEAVVPALGGLSIAAGYFLSVPYAAPRFLLPSYALLAVPAAQGAIRASEWAERRWGRRVVRGVCAALVFLFLAEQGTVLARQLQVRAQLDRYNAAVVAVLRSAGIRGGGCVVAGPVTYQIAFAAGCWDDFDALVPPARSERAGANEGDDVADAATERARSGHPPAAYALVLPTAARASAPGWVAGWRRVSVHGRFIVYLPRR